MVDLDRLRTLSARVGADPLLVQAAVGTSLILLLAEMGVMVNIGRNGERAAQQRAAAHAQRQAAKAQRDAELKDRTINLDDARRARNEL